VELCTGDEARGVAVDSQDNIIVVGDHGSSVSSEDWNVTKLDPNGNQIWSYNASLGVDDTAIGVAVDSQDNIIVVGQAGNTDEDWNVTKLDSDGNQLWSYEADSGGGDVAYDVAVDSQDNIIVVGHVIGSDWNVTKLDSDGNQLWSYRANLGAVEIAYGVAVDSQDNIIVVGQAKASDDWNVTKLDSDGNQLWSYEADLGGNDQARGVAVDSQDNIIVVGDAKSSDDWNVTKLDSDGNQLWSYEADLGGNDQANSVAVDSQDNIIVVGQGGTDWNVTKLDSNGNQLWSYNATFGGADRAGGVAVDSSDNIIVVGGAAGDWNVTKLSGGLNPLSCGNMKQDDKCQLNWTINASGNNLSVFAIDVNFTSSLVGVEANDTEDHLICIGACPGPAAAPDNTPPVINGTINNTSPKFGEIINATYNITDVGGTLSTGNISINNTGPPAKNFSFILDGAAAEMSQNMTINFTRGVVLNITGFAFDGTNIAQNSTLITVANTPAPQASIEFPTDDFKTNLQPLDLNVTYTTDPDKDVLNITYYIDGKINQTQIELNTTFNASDGTYILNVSLHDNVTQIEYSANISINFTIDTIVPVLNASLNESLTNIGKGDIINLTANATDERTVLSFGQIIVNDTGFKRYFNFSLDAEREAEFSQNITVACNGGCVINFTARVNDTAGNFRTNDTIITVVDKINPVVNTTLNKSTNIIQGNVINLTANVTDNIELANGTIIINASPAGSSLTRYFNFSLEGLTAAQISQNITIDCDEGCVINFTVRVNDTSGNTRTNDTIITVAASNSVPAVVLVNATGFSVDPVAGGDASITIVFNATDADDVEQINGTDGGSTEIIVNLTLGTPRNGFGQHRTQTTCTNHTVGSGSTGIVVFNCTINMRYYDNASSDWVINITVIDSNGGVGRNDSEGATPHTFIYNSLSSFSLNVRGIGEDANLNFSSLTVGQNNIEAKAPILLNNTGNDDFDQINITGSSLLSGSNTIAIGSFSVNTTNSTTEERGIALDTSPVTIPASAGESLGLENPNATLLHGPGISGDTVPYQGPTGVTGNRTLIFYVDVPGGTASGTYNNTWNITVINIP